MDHDCMDHQPGPDARQFTCPVCGVEYVLAGVQPGDYWETKACCEAQQTFTLDILIGMGLPPDRARRLTEGRS